MLFRSVKDTTDAWGQITTPFGTFDALRIHTMEIFSDSVWAQPLFPPTWSLVSSSSDTTHSYAWVGKGGKLAIAEMSFDTLGAPKIFKWTELPGIGVGINENFLEMKVYPNPFNEILRISGVTNETPKIFDLAGREKQIEFILEENEILINTASLSPGF